MTSAGTPRQDRVPERPTAVGETARPVVRDRRPEDLPALLTLLLWTHENEGYPVRASAVRADWIAAPGELLGAVAVTGATVAGHIALHPADDADETALSPWQRATGRVASELAVVSRFFTDGAAPGTGTLLLTHAMERATQLGRVAVLMVDPASPARGFYGRRGWREVGTSRQQWGHRTVDAVLMAPDVSTARRSPPRR